MQTGRSLPGIISTPVQLLSILFSSIFPSNLSNNKGFNDSDSFFLNLCLVMKTVAPSMICYPSIVGEDRLFNVFLLFSSCKLEYLVATSEYLL